MKVAIETAMKTIMETDFWGWIILTILAIDGIRNIVAHVGWVPINSSWYSRFIYGKQDEKIIERALLNLGYQKKEAKKIHDNMTPSRKQQIIGMPDDICYRKLIGIIKKCLIPTMLLQYGNTQTYFYIHTMMGSQNQDLLEDMSDLLIHQILRDYPTTTLDYVIVPKSGNPLLGRYVASRLGVNCILHKDKGEKSYANNPGEMMGRSKPVLDYEINFEGAYFLDKKKPLIGVVVDCNTSGGTQLINAANGFNTVIDQMGLPFKQITNIYVLFRVDNKHKEIDQNFLEQGGLKLNRIFDITEKIKTSINDMEEDIDIYSPCDAVKSLISTMKNDKQLLLSRDI